MFNHTKDVTFAAAMMGATYFLLKATRDLPRPRLRDVLLFGAMLGSALGLRATGLRPRPLSRRCDPAAALRRYRRDRARPPRVHRPIAAGSDPRPPAGYLIMIAAWPWAALHPFNPVRALFAFSQFHYEIRDLFAGQIYRMDEMPRWYMPVYLAIRLPLLLLAGAALALVLAAWPRLFRLTITERMRTEVAL